MTRLGAQNTSAGMRFVAATALAVSLAVAPTLALSRDKDVHEDRAELRIKDLQAKLKIAPAQEDQWSKVAQIMRENAKKMDSLVQARADHAKGMSAIDDLSTYGEIADANADGVKKLTPEFTALYNSMSDSQKKGADILLSRGDGRQRRMMSKGK